MADFLLAQGTSFEPQQIQVVCNLAAFPTHRACTSPSEIPNHTQIEPTWTLCLHQLALTCVYHPMANFTCKFRLWILVVWYRSCYEDMV